MRDLNAWYGESHVLPDMTFEVNPGEVVTLLGRNGAGKTTTMRAIMAMLANRKGSIKFQGQELIGEPHCRARHCLLLRGARHFLRLSVWENLLLPPRIKKLGGSSVPEIYNLFPNLEQRSPSQGIKLSGGEQQMLAIARICAPGPIPAP